MGEFRCNTPPGRFTINTYYAKGWIDATVQQRLTTRIAITGNHCVAMETAEYRRRVDACKIPQHAPPLPPLHTVDIDSGGEVYLSYSCFSDIISSYQRGSALSPWKVPPSFIPGIGNSVRVNRRDWHREREVETPKRLFWFDWCGGHAEYKRRHWRRSRCAVRQVGRVGAGR